MKTRILLFMVVSLATSVSQACGLDNPTRHTNPDGSIGGLVSSTAKVDSTSYVSYYSKVCDSSWVEKNARLENNVIAKENSWIRENSIIQNNAVISGNAVIWGSTNFPAVVKDFAQVYGSARILSGSIIQDYATVYGTVTLRGARVSSKAKVCEGFVLNDVSISDEYFCPENEVESRAIVRLISHSENYFHEPNKKLIFEAEKFQFSRDVNVYQIRVNGELVESNDIQVNAKQVIVSDVLLDDGENEILFSGRDEFTKKITSRRFTIYAGTGTRSIAVEGVENEKLTVELKFKYDGLEFFGKIVHKNGLLIITGIPSNREDVSAQLNAIGSSHFISENFDNLTDLPSSIQASPIPVFQNNTFDFSNGLSGWSISHIENAEIVGEGQNARLDIRPHSTEKVVLAKTFKLNSEVNGLGVDFAIRSNLLKTFSDTDKVEIILVSTTERKIVNNSYDLRLLNAFNKKTGELVDFNQQIKKALSGTSEITVIARLSPDSSTSFSEDPLLSFFGARLLRVFIDFHPKHFAPRHLEAKAPGATDLIPSTSPESLSNCTNPLFELKTNNNIEHVPPELDQLEIEFFSASPIPMLANIFNENRIFGDLSISGVPKEKVLAVRLVGEQYGQRVFTQSLSTCAKYVAERGSVYNGIYIPHGTNLVNYLFAVPLLKLVQVNPLVTYATVGPNGNTTKTAGATITLKIEADVQEGLQIRTFVGSPREKKIFSSPDLTSAYTYKPFDRTEAYDSRVEDVVLTGGDKWMEPVFSPILKNIMSLHSGSVWQVNDLSKMNGGRFLGHQKTHNSGVDADILLHPSLSPVFDFEKTLSKDQWTILLDRIESFIDGNKDYHGSVRDYLLTISDLSIPATNQKILRNRFLNRCIGDRFSSLATAFGTGSIIRDAVDHHDHFHLRFNGLDSYGEAFIYPKNLPSDASISDFIYGLEDDQLFILPKASQEQKYSNRVLLWRFQDRRNPKDFEVTVQFGNWPFNLMKSRKDIFRKPSANKSDDFRFIHLVIGKKTSGWCVVKELEVDPNILNLKRSQGYKWWTYVNTSDGFKMVFLEKKI